MDKCNICLQPAEWTMQDMGESWVFTCLDSHYRGTKLYKVCDTCKEDVLRGDMFLVVDGLDRLRVVPF